MSKRPATPTVDRKFAEVCARRRRVPDRWREDFIQEVLVRAYAFMADGIVLRLACWRAERAAAYELRKWLRDESAPEDNALGVLSQRRHKERASNTARAARMRDRWRAFEGGKE